FRLAGIRPSPDPVGWLQIFTYWHTFGQRTNRLGAVRLRPASHVTISLEGLDDRQYWQLTHEPSDLDLQAHADATFEAFEESAAWRARRFRRCLIALSGGLDSRMVAAAHPNDVDAIAFTLVTAPNGQHDLEASTAAKVAACLQLPHEISRIKLGNYSSVIDDVVLLTQGLMPMHHPAKTMHFLERMTDGYSYLLGGGPGDVLAGAYIPSAVYLDPARAEVLRDEFYEARQQLAAYLGLIFSSDWLTEYRHVIRDSFLETWEVLKGPTAAHRATAWGMLIRQPAFTFSGPLHNHPYFDEGTAHLGYKYTDLMLRLPAHWLYQRNFYKYMVHRCIPKLREVVYSNTGQKLSGHLDNLTAPPWHPCREWFSKRLHRSL